MRIENLPLPVTSPAAGGQPLDKAASEALEASTGLPTDAVQVSRLARTLLGHSDGSLRVEQLRQQFADGSYQPSALEVGKRIVDFHLQK